MKIILFAGTYGLSGVPIAQYRLAESFAKNGHEVELVYGRVLDNTILPHNQNFKINVLNKNKVSLMFFKIINILYKQKPDIIFSAGDHLNAIVLLAGILVNSKSKFSCSSRVTPFDTYSNKLFSKNWILKKVMKMVMHKATVLSCVSKDMVQQYKKIFNNSKHVAIYNIVKNKETEAKMHEKLNEKDEIYFKKKYTIISAGMLERWKRHEDLIYAFDYFKYKNECNLLILGDGSRRKILEKQIKNLKLEHSIHLLGNISNPLKFFSRSNVFVLSSEVEGMPNALIEAMMCGCTPVSTNCETGPKEIINNNYNGYLVPVGNPKMMSKGLENAIEKPIEKQTLDDSVKPFQEDNVIKEHFKMLNLKIDY